MSEETEVMCSMILEGQLPCGCAFGHAVRNVGPINSKFPKFAGDVLQCWLDNRMPRHRCELVSETNKYGLVPRETTEKQA
jgi:hypothetical protein